MKHKKVFLVLGSLSLLAFLLFFPFSQSDKEPTPTPTLTPNLAPMPDMWEEWNGGINEYIFIDYSVTHNGNPSLRVEWQGWGERDGFVKKPNYWIPISPGDHIIFKCWMRLNAGNGYYGGRPEYSGARLGIDFYDNIGWIGDTSALNGNPRQTSAETIASFVNWGTTTWTLRTMEFYVQNTYDEMGNARVPTGMIPWIQVMPWANTGYAWFADCELYVNPQV